MNANQLNYLISLRNRQYEAQQRNDEEDYLDIIHELNSIRNANKNAELDIIRHSEYCDEL